MTLSALVILALAQTPTYAPPVYFGVVYDLVDGSADGIPGWYQAGAFRDANTAEPFAPTSGSTPRRATVALSASS